MSLYEEKLILWLGCHAITASCCIEAADFCVELVTLPWWVGEDQWCCF